MTFSTYKSFGGPAGGVIVTNDAALAERVATAVYPGLTANYDIARLLPLGAAALEHAALRRRLRRRLHRQRPRAGGRARGARPRRRSARRADFTDSHHVAVDVRALGGGTRAARAGSPRRTSCSRRSAVPRPTTPTRRARSASARRAVTRQGFAAGRHAGRSRRRSPRGLDDRTDPRALRGEVAAIRRR